MLTLACEPDVIFRMKCELAATSIILWQKLLTICKCYDHFKWNLHSPHSLLQQVLLSMVQGWIICVVPSPSSRIIESITYICIPAVRIMQKWPRKCRTDNHRDKEPPNAQQCMTKTMKLSQKRHFFVGNHMNFVAISAQIMVLK